MTALIAGLIELLTVHVSPSGPVLARHIRALGGESYVAAHAEDYRAAAELEGVPVALLAALAFSESSLNPRAVGALGEGGEMQLHAGNLNEWRRICRTIPEHCGVANLVIGASVLARFFERCGGDWDLAASAYKGLGCRRTGASARVMAMVSTMEEKP